ncbi:MAG: SufE family protein [Gammaproteobacteria bacterium]|nr:SufE family protein [Gammaproteobacteria bacterium]MCP4089172.1 SufE family protein [Gammaproteobacteria bacterium]MCP4276804.1 SufE family protein [Gammaproteobacteria bacterium]MCP4830647.1 SufE family protein [Gammaproteobacteria bacterium]MCP4928456.1 SufE family protein [Gammaproteobacteria bacterium]
MSNVDITQAQVDLINDFQLFDNWLDRYEYLIDLGRKLPEFPSDWKTEEYKLHGCQSQVWLKADEANGKLTFHAISDSAIVSGLIAVLIHVYSDRNADEILTTPPDFIDAIGLHEHLSPTRSNGLHAMIDAIRGHAVAIQCAG